MGSRYEFASELARKEKRGGKLRGEVTDDLAIKCEFEGNAGAIMLIISLAVKKIADAVEMDIKDVCGMLAEIADSEATRIDEIATTSFKVGRSANRDNGSQKGTLS